MLDKSMKINLDVGGAAIVVTGMASKTCGFFFSGEGNLLLGYRITIVYWPTVRTADADAKRVQSHEQASAQCQFRGPVELQAALDEVLEDKTEKITVGGLEVIHHGGNSAWRFTGRPEWKVGFFGVFWNRPPYSHNDGGYDEVEEP